MKGEDSNVLVTTKLDEPNTGNDDQKRKKYRKRKRHFFNDIRAQMEFYFGDANLSKDRYLKQLIDKDPYVPLSVFLTFNKIKRLTSNVADIAKSLSNSQLLELDADQEKVRRKVALPLERCVDHKTIYVEAIPQSADHDWVRAVFERFGEVAYVSLPKYKNSNKIKEFGFVEYENEESVEKALKAFQEIDGVLCMQSLDPAELTSVKSFIIEQKNESTKGEKQEHGVKRKQPHFVDESVEPVVKRAKTDEDTTNTSNDDASSSSSSSEDEENEKEVKADVNDEQGLKKKRRKKSGKSKRTKQKTDPNINADAAHLELKILPKRDWKRLRNKYLNLQREKIAEIKRQAWRSKQELADNTCKENSSDLRDNEKNTAGTSTANTKPSEHKLRRMNMNFYGAGDDDSNTKNNLKEPKENVALERQPLFTFEPGLIVEISFLEPCVSVKEFKTDMRQYATVKYVDVREGAMHSYLRLETPDAAQEFVRQVNSAEYKCKILSGDEESEYWKKIEKDREMKLNKQVKVPQKRGRDKIKKLLNNHIRFDDEE